MTPTLHPGPHLDAEQLNAFAEGVLPEHERQQSLAHLAECAECRRIAFLAHEPEPVATPAPQPFWSRWFAPLALVGAVAVCAVLVVLSLNLHHPSPSNEAANRSPQPPVIPSTPQASPKPEPLPPARLTPDTASTPPLRSVAPVPIPPPPAAPSFSADSNAAATTISPARPSDVAGNLQPPDRARSQSSIHGSVSAAPVLSDHYALAPPPPAPADAGTTADKAQEASTGEAKKLAAPTAPPPASLALRFEPGQAPIDNSAALKGYVTDLTGASIPGATITLRQLTGSATTQTATNGAGAFIVPFLPAGKYEMQIASPGFRSLSRQIELKPHDLALLNSTLTVSAASQTVEVATDSRQIATESATTGALISERATELPGKHTAVTTVANGTTALAIDASGNLYLRRNGKRWKAVHPQWQGKVTQLSLAPSSSSSGGLTTSQAAPLPPPATPPPAFRLTTDNGTVWFSQDGEHWSPL